jgi:hypothetical protein
VESLAGTRFYLPKDRGVEARLRERLEEIRKARGKTTFSPSP